MLKYSLKASVTSSVELTPIFFTFAQPEIFLVMKWIHFDNFIFNLKVFNTYMEKQQIILIGFITGNKLVACVFLSLNICKSVTLCISVAIKLCQLKNFQEFCYSANPMPPLSLIVVFDESANWSNKVKWTRLIKRIQLFRYENTFNICECFINTHWREIIIKFGNLQRLLILWHLL